MSDLLGAIARAARSHDGGHAEVSFAANAPSVPEMDPYQVRSAISHDPACVTATNSW